MKNKHKNRIATPLEKIFGHDARIEAAKVDVGFAAAVSRILAEERAFTGAATKMPRSVLKIADAAYDVLMCEGVPSSEWGV